MIISKNNASTAKEKTNRKSKVLSHAGGILDDQLELAVITLHTLHWVPLIEVVALREVFVRPIFFPSLFSHLESKILHSSE